MPANRPSVLWNQHVRAGQAFSAENFVIPGGGLLGHIQLFNPAGSGIRVRLRSAHQIATSVSNSNVRRHDVALAVLGPPAGFISENLLGGQPAPAAEMRSAALAAAVGTTFWTVNAPANVPAPYPPGEREWGHDLLPGQGILFQAAAGVVLIVNWQWVEVPL